ncbi:hypothetical protein CPB85DRAFT_699383 [Mucidula mucida]|nr:hypothetical protein CPB85DRAFT_699383 [Mucidula mucida]
MVLIKVRNDSSLKVNVGFHILGMLHPGRHFNDVKPGACFEAGDFASFLPQSFEVRSTAGAFKGEETIAHARQMALAGSAGTAALLTGAAGGGPALAASGALWHTASDVGREYMYGKEMPSTLKRVVITV